jgi:hypothetical protein
MAVPPTRPPEPPAPVDETSYDLDPPTPAEARRYRVVLQRWVIFFLIILVSGMMNYLWGFFVRG